MFDFDHNQLNSATMLASCSCGSELCVIACFAFDFARNTRVYTSLDEIASFFIVAYVYILYNAINRYFVSDSFSSSFAHIAKFYYQQKNVVEDT